MSGTWGVSEASRQFLNLKLSVPGLKVLFCHPPYLFGRRFLFYYSVFYFLVLVSFPEVHELGPRPFAMSELNHSVDIFLVL